MTIPTMITVDGNEAAASIAYLINEVIAIYPITPASSMGELADEWASSGRQNLWGAVPKVIEMQSEAGAAGAVHGALQGGALSTTFTASQGLLLMIPNMYKIAGELTPTVFHIAARAIATHALSIFGDHSDVMAARSTGFAMLASNNPQEAQDLALVAQAASLRGRLPVLHFFDGFRTSHEVAKISALGQDVVRAMLDESLIAEHRQRALSPEHPVLRGSSQNPDVFFQSRERINSYYNDFPAHMQAEMDRFAELTGRHYRLFEYAGAADADRVIVLMGSGGDTVEETVTHLNAHGEKVGLLKVRLYRPLDAQSLLDALPKSAGSIAVLDRCKEAGAEGDPLYKDVLTLLAQAYSAGKLSALPRVMGGRYGLASKEFTPGMAKAVFDAMKKGELKTQFTLGITDDLTHLSLPWEPGFRTDANRKNNVAIFFGLGSDGTVSANKNSIKIIGESTPLYAQGYFVYDSKKAGAVTVSHLRFGPEPIRSAYLIGNDEAAFVACHQQFFLQRYDMLDHAEAGGTFLLNTQAPAEMAWETLPRRMQQQIIDKKLSFYVIDAYQVAEQAGMGRRINTVMQTCFFAISGVLPREQAIDAIKQAVEKTYGRKGRRLVELNYKAIDATLENLHQVQVPAAPSSTWEKPPAVAAGAPEFVRRFTAELIAGRGDALPVSLMPADGTFPLGTAAWEKRNLALEIPVWESDICTQCGKCVFVCPHSAIRSRLFTAEAAANAPSTFKHVVTRSKEFAGAHISYQVAPEDCTGCGLCVDACPIHDKSNVSRKALNMAKLVRGEERFSLAPSPSPAGGGERLAPLPQGEGSGEGEMHPSVVTREAERENFAFFLGLAEYDREKVKHTTIPGSMLLDPLFEFSGACLGCGETPYIRLATQLFGDRMLVANATGCSSIYGGNLPTTPYTTNSEGRGPAWNNSLFEDNAEFGLGLRLAADQLMGYAQGLVKSLANEIGGDLAEQLLAAPQVAEAEIRAQRKRVAALLDRLKSVNAPQARYLEAVAEYLIRRSVWIIGGDGWAYDIGYGGLDHVIAQAYDVNLLVLDTEVYSNTGGQTSKATPLGAVAKFSAAGKPTRKKDLAKLAMDYEHVYVAHVAFGAKDVHTLRVFHEAETYPGPSLIIAYSPCIAHGVDLSNNLRQQDLAVKSGHWPLFRYDPRERDAGNNPLRLDSAEPSIPFKEFASTETRFTMLARSHPEEAANFIKAAEAAARLRYAEYKELAELSLPGKDKKEAKHD